MTDPRDNAPLPKDVEPSIADRIAALPEIYQTIFGHPELSTAVSRQCEDRLVHIAGIYKTLEAKLNRSLRVLDLGCAQGFFSLSLAKLGATVHGIDFLGANIDVCKALAAEHPGFFVHFQERPIEDVIVNMQPDEYDLVLGLSVFHHIVHKSGVVFVQKMLTFLAHRTVASIYEIALASEPIAWAVSQPQDPRQLLTGYTFAHEFTQNSTHLSAVNRPLYIASNRYWFLDGQAGVIETAKTEPHALAGNVNAGTRHFYSGGGLLIKLYTMEVAERRYINETEYANETAFLSHPPADFKAPALLLHGRHERELWLVREQVPGDLLLDLMTAKTPYNAGLILRDVLQQLAALEAVGLYHDDLRVWNVLVMPDGHASLIDYGAISRAPVDCAWPHNLFLSFKLFVWEVISGVVLTRNPTDTPSFSPNGFPDLYHALFLKLYALPVAERRFAVLRDMFSALA